MFEKLEWSEKRFEELARLMSDPKKIANQAEFSKYAKERSDLSKIVEIYRQYKKAAKELEENKVILNDEKDEEIRDLAKDEIERLTSSAAEIEKNLKLLLLPKDPNDERNIFVEIRAGAGGEEAALFASELFRMYS